MNNTLSKVIKTFLIRSAIVYVVWLIAFHGFIIPNQTVNRTLSNAVVDATSMGLSLMGYDTKQVWKTERPNDSRRYIFIDAEPAVLVADGCNGLELIALFVGFILCFPGPIKYKLIFIPIGSFFVFLINIFREIALALNFKFFERTFDLNHKYTYVLIVYLLVFVMWRFWLNNYSVIGKKVK